MISGSVSGDLDGLADFLASFERNYLDDLRALAERIRAFVVEANARGILAGTDAEGRPMAPLKPSTLKRRSGSGPPTAPHGANSRVIRDFDAKVLISNDGKDVVITASYKSFEAISYFNSGTADMARRVVSGIRPADMDVIYGMCDDFMRGQAARFG